MKQVWRRVIILLLLVAACVPVAVSLWYAAGKRADMTCLQTEIRIERDGALVYLQQQDVENWLSQHGISLKDKSFSALSASNVEQVLLQNPYVRSAQVFLTEDAKCHLLVGQRNPVLKIVNTGQTMFQLDESGVEMPVNPAYTARLRVAGGHIPVKPVYGREVTRIPDTLPQAVLKRVYEINRFLCQDPFWDAMFEQIYVTEDSEYELIPKVGGQQIRLGRISSVEELAGKMHRLKLFYRRGMTPENWRKYSVLDLKYENQIVATRKSGYAKR